MIRYYAEPELHKCNDKLPMEGEHESDWNKPTNFVGEFANCGKPTGKLWLARKGAMDACKDATESILDFKGKKAEEYMKENFVKTWDHFDVLKEGHFEIEKAPMFLRMFCGGNPELTFGL